MKRKKKRNPAMTAGLLIIGFFLLVAIFAPFIAPYDPNEMMISYLRLPGNIFWEPMT